MLVTSLISMLYMWYAYMPEFPFGPRDIRPLLILRGLSGFFGVSGLYFSLVYLPISEAVVLTFLAPMLSCYLYSFLQPDEAFTRIHQFGAYISMVGVVFIARPDTLFASSSSSSSASTPTTRNTTTVIDATPHDALLPEPPAPTTSQHLFAIALAMMGVIGGAIALTTVRYIGKRAHPLISITYFSVWCTFVSSLSFIFIPGIDFKLPQNLTEWNLFFIVGITGFIMQVFLTVGLAYSTNNAPASAPSSTSPTPKLHTNTNPAGKSGGSKATAMMYTQMLFALLFDKIFWGTGPNLWSWIGSGLILGSVIWVSIQGEEDQDLRPSSQPQYPEGTEAMDPASPNHDDNGPVMQDQDLEMSYIARDTVRKGSVRVQERFVTEDNEEEEVRGLLDGSYDDVDPVDNIEGTCS